MIKNLIAIGAVVFTATFIAPAQKAVAETSAIPNPMATPNPMMPTPGSPMSPLSISPMQPLGGLAGTVEAGVERDPELGNLPVGPGAEDTFYSCTACHSVQTFAQQRLTDERWEYLWDWMIETQGMPDYGNESRKVILAYLKEHFSSER